MTACVFVGPTLPRSDVVARLDAICLPPVAQGDVLRAVRRYGPRAVGLIDGVFGGAPAVWHKEILWAVREGVAVFGGASMGALRAAELHGFGMRGVGRIFEAYRDGRLEDDDEVAVIHGPAELGFMPLSEPMVTIRETLSRAVAAGVLDPAAGAALVRRAKALHFPDRSWAVILAGAGDDGIAVADRTRFADWLATGRVDPKREDALAMLAAMRAFDPGTATSEPFHFEATHHWANLASRPEPAGDGAAFAHRVLDELRLGPRSAYQAIATRAWLRFAATDASGRQGGVGHDPDAVERATNDLRATLELYTGGARDAWMARNDLDPAGFRLLAARSAQLDRFAGRAGPFLSDCLLDELRLGGDYARLADRARRKAARLGDEPSARPGDLAPPERLALRRWFGERRLGSSGDPDLETLLKATGFSDPESLDRALHRERSYLTLIAPSLDD